MNQPTKPWYLSKGFLGPLTTAVLFSLRNLGIADIDTETMLGILYQGTEFAGIVVGMVGRATARTRLTLGPVQAPLTPAIDESETGAPREEAHPVKGTQAAGSAADFVRNPELPKFGWGEG
jgi:hypothetical protein